VSKRYTVIKNIMPTTPVKDPVRTTNPPHARIPAKVIRLLRRKNTNTANIMFKYSENQLGFCMVPDIRKYLSENTMVFFDCPHRKAFVSDTIGSPKISARQRNTTIQKGIT